MKIYVCYTQQYCEGYSEPEAVFTDESQAKKWVSNGENDEYTKRLYLEFEV